MYPFSTSWKHQKTLRFSDVFRGHRKSALGTNGLIFLVNSKSLLKSLILNGIYNSKQNTWNKVKASRKISQNQKILILIFCHYSRKEYYAQDHVPLNFGNLQGNCYKNLPLDINFCLRCAKSYLN